MRGGGPGKILSFHLFSRISTVLALISALIALMVYFLTMEPTVSLWDCGEFISCAYKLQITHPPGAPFYILMGRLFAMFAPSPDQVAMYVNALSAVSSAGAVFFLFLVIVFYGRRVLHYEEGAPVRLSDAIAIWAGGFAGSLSLAFADSFWFSALEAEVYALSIFLASMMVWAITRWVRVKDQPHADRWLLLIALLSGLVLSVHLLGLLALPFVVMVWYQHKFGLTSWKHYLVAFLIGVAFIGLYNFLLLPRIPWLLTRLELFAVNTLGLPFYTGMIAGLLLLAGLSVWIVYRFGYRDRKRTALAFAGLSFLLVLIGYSSYTMAVIRSRANPPIDMNNPEDPFLLLAYIEREQYGKQPLLWGPVFTAQPVGFKHTGKRYRMNDSLGRYVFIGYQYEPEYRDEDMMFFPRIWSGSHQQFYRAWLDLRPRERPTWADNIRFFFTYQLGWMYWRYFLWNFAGRQNDIQGHGLDLRNGHWLSGISILDEGRLGPQKPLPYFQEWNPGRNRFFLVPLILGLLGLAFMIVRRPEDAFTTFLLFFMWGIAIIIYLNQYPQQPRERDYSYAGSFWAFSLWIGIAAPALYAQVREFLEARKLRMVTVAGLLAAFSTLASPLIMAVEGWDDHTRANRFTARDIAISYLESCAPNAILFTEGDNDTYPLWYAQEVEGVRPDVRIINLSLLGVDWYIDFLRQKVNEADPVPIQVHPSKYAGSTRDFVPFIPAWDTLQYFELETVLKAIFSDDPRTRYRSPGTGELIDFLPARKVKITIDNEDIQKLIRTGAITPEDTSRIVREMRWILPRTLLKNDLMLLHIIVANDWERPIYFAVTIPPSSFVGLTRYLQLEGMTFRLVPIRSEGSFGMYGRVATDVMFRNVMEKFRWGDLKKFDYVYLDENHRRLLYNMRLQVIRLAEALLREGKKDSARVVLERLVEEIPDRHMPWGFLMAHASRMLYLAGNPRLAWTIADTLLQRASRDLRFYFTVAQMTEVEKRALVLRSYQSDLQELAQIATLYDQTGRETGDSLLMTRARGVLASLDSLFRTYPDLVQIFVPSDGRRRRNPPPAP